MKDKNGKILRVGDKVHDVYGFDLIVRYTKTMGWYGKLVCDDNDSCKNIPYALVSDEIEKID